MSAAPCERCHGSGEIARDDGRFRLVPTPCPECTWSELDALRAELAALKARRCDGCAHYGSSPGVGFGRCALAERYDEAMSVGSAVLHVKPDHSCAAWTEKP